MSNISIATLPRLTPTQLSKLLLSSKTSSQVAIVDVRDSDYIGGHIRGCHHVPMNQLDHKTPELVRTLQQKGTVVFHCMLSQQRGPSAALRYARERERLLGSVGRGEVVLKGDADEWVEEAEREVVKDEKGGECVKRQRVAILEGGFGKWQESFGEDERITEGYQKDLWEMGYD